jgi:5-oxoprolinase (ATP-hydrolysing) subunit A
MSITINSDMGESLGIHSFGNDDGLLEFIDQANVACGFHSGDPVGIHTTVRNAAEAGLDVGAHPGLPDLAGFGRREMKLEAEEVRDLVMYQVGALSAFLKAVGIPLHHIKPHGSLYGMVARDEALMDAVCDIAELYQVPVYGMANTIHEKVATRRGVPFVSELYVDLGYRADGSLIIQRRPHATPLDVAAERTRRALVDHEVTADTGESVPMRFETICIHSDTPNAIDVARTVRAVVDEYAGS